VQLHDFNGGIQQSGLFWIVQVPDDALKIEGLTAKLHVENASVIVMTSNSFLPAEFRQPSPSILHGR
jgi:hypothetical protein